MNQDRNLRSEQQVRLVCLLANTAFPRTLLYLRRANIDMHAWHLSVLVWQPAIAGAAVVSAAIDALDGNCTAYFREHVRLAGTTGSPPRGDAQREDRVKLDALARSAGAAAGAMADTKRQPARGNALACVPRRA